MMNDKHVGRIHQGDEIMEIAMNEEMSGPDHHKIMSQQIAEKLADDLDIRYSDRSIVAKLIFSLITDMVYDMLREYENVVADKMHGSIKSHLEYRYKIDLESGVDYSHAAHAKLSSLMEEVEEKLIPNEKQDK